MRIVIRAVSKRVLRRHLVADELQKITTCRSHLVSAGVGSDEIPFEGTDVASYDHFQVFEFAVGKTVKEHLHPAADIVLANVALSERIRPD